MTSLSRGTSYERPVRLQPTDLLGHTDDRLGEPRAGNAQLPEDGQQLLAVLAHLGREVTQLPAGVWAELAPGGALEQVEPASGRRHVVPKVDGPHPPRGDPEGGP